VTTQPIRRVVFDTNVVLSALLFPNGRLAWLREHWREGGAVPLISSATARELARVLAYPKFRLSEQYSIELLALYLPYCESVDLESLGAAEKCPIACRDAKDQPFLDLAQAGKAHVLVSGDEDLLALAGQTEFVVESPEDYRRRVCGVQEGL
jgi:putative PIN family toxin of toxin-antitoxin system